MWDFLASKLEKMNMVRRDLFKLSYQIKSLTSNRSDESSGREWKDCCDVKRVLVRKEVKPNFESFRRVFWQGLESVVMKKKAPVRKGGFWL